MIKNEKQLKGFTLLELLIVIAVLAILSMALILVLNPAESLKKSRDTQRLNDLATLKTAIGLYLTNTASPLLDNGTNATCKDAAGWVLGDKIYYSLPGAGTITDTTLDGSVDLRSSQVAAANASLTDGTGWVPVNLSGMTGGSPISNMPLDPTNTISALGNVSSSDLVYRYVCNQSDLTFEIDARLESAQYGPSGTDDKASKDGGNNAGLFEVGTKLDILGSGADF